MRIFRITNGFNEMACCGRQHLEKHTEHQGFINGTGKRKKVWPRAWAFEKVVRLKLP